MSANYGNAATWNLPYRTWTEKVPTTDQQRREAFVETIIYAYCEDDDEATYDQLAVIRPDLEGSQIWEYVEELCHLSGEVAFQENQRGAVEAFEAIKDDYNTALAKFARAPLATVPS